MDTALKRPLEAAAGEAQAPEPKIPNPRLENHDPTRDGGARWEEDGSVPIPRLPDNYIHASPCVQRFRAEKPVPKPRRGDFVHLDNLCQDRVIFYRHPPWLRLDFPGTEVAKPTCSVQIKNPACAPPEGLFFGPIHWVHEDSRAIAVVVPMPTRGPHVQYRVPETPRDCPDVLPEDHDKFNRGIIPGLVWVTLYTFPHAYGRCIDVPYTWAYNHLDLASDHVLAQWFRQGHQVTFRASEFEIGCALQQLAITLDEHFEGKTVRNGLGLNELFPSMNSLIMEERAAGIPGWSP